MSLTVYLGMLVSSFSISKFLMEITSNLVTPDASVFAGRLMKSPFVKPKAFSPCPYQTNVSIDLSVMYNLKEYFFFAGGSHDVTRHAVDAMIATMIRYIKFLI